MTAGPSAEAPAKPRSSSTPPHLSTVRWPWIRRSPARHVRPLSYQSAPLEAAGQLRRLLRDQEPPPIPIHLIHPAGRYLAPKVRLFIDRAVAALRGRFEKDVE